MADFRNKKILVVDDEEEISGFLESNLRRAGFEVVSASDGKSAVAKVKSFNPDIVVLDIVLPELNGLDVLKWIKENNPDICVIMATAKNEVEDIKEGYSCKADCYIVKPYKVEEILKAISTLLSLGGR